MESVYAVVESRSPASHPNEKAKRRTLKNQRVRHPKNQSQSLAHPAAIVLERGAETIFWNAKGRDTRPRKPRTTNNVARKRASVLPLHWILRDGSEQQEIDPPA